MLQQCLEDDIISNFVIGGTKQRNKNCHPNEKYITTRSGSRCSDIYSASKIPGRNSRQTVSGSLLSWQRQSWRNESDLPFHLFCKLLTVRCIRPSRGHLVHKQISLPASGKQGQSLSGEDHSVLELITFWAEAQMASPRNLDGENLARDQESWLDTLAGVRRLCVTRNARSTSRFTAVHLVLQFFRSTAVYNLNSNFPIKVSNWLALFCIFHRKYFMDGIFHIVGQYKRYRRGYLRQRSSH